MVASTAARRGRPSSTTVVDAAVLAVATAALRIPSLLASRHLTFDDGVYGASAVAMREGGWPYRDVFSSQGPLFLPVVWLADLVGFRTSVAPRLASVAAGVALAVTAYLVARRTADRPGALLAGGLVATAGSVWWVTGPLAADGVALAAATATVAAAIAWRDCLDGRRAVLLGLGVGATLSVKALLVGAVLPVALVLLASGRIRTVLLAAATALAGHLLVWLPFGPADVWDQAYGYHLDVAGHRTPGANLAKVASTLADRDLPVLVLGAIALAAAAGGLARTFRERSGARPATRPRGEHMAHALRRLGVAARSVDVLIVSWILATSVVLAGEHPMWRPHVSQLVPPLAMLAARHRPPARVLLVLVAAAVPLQVVRSWDLLDPGPYRGSAATAVGLMRALPEGALAISDDPGLVWRAGRATPPDLVDASRLRIDSGRLDEADIVAAAADRRVCAVVVRSAQRWGSFAGLPERLAALGYVVADAQGVRRTYVAPGCDPP